MKNKNKNKNKYIKIFISKFTYKYYFSNISNISLCKFNTYLEFLI